MDLLNILKRHESLFNEDIKNHEIELRDIIRQKSFLVVGGAGTIGQACVRKFQKITI